MYADDYIDSLIFKIFTLPDEDFENKLDDAKLIIKSYESKELHWITKHGERILIQDMDTDHILNALRWLHNRRAYPSWSTKAVVRILKEELKKRK